MKMSKIKRIAYNKIKSHFLVFVSQNENTTKNNILIHENIEKRQLKKNFNDSMWNDIFLFYYDDLKIILRILTMQNCRRDVEKSYDFRKWIISNLNFWHLRLNFLKLIHKNHWNDFKSTNEFTLQFVVDVWKRNNVNIDQNFIKLKAFLIHFYQTKIFVVTMHLCNNRREKFVFIRFVFNRQWKFVFILFVFKFEKWFKRLKFSNYENLVNELIVIVHFFNFQIQFVFVIENEMFENHFRFIKHMKIYFQLRHFIKYDDIELLKHVLRNICVIFQISKENIFNYATKLIRFVHLYCSETSNVILQKAILINSFVNLQNSNDKCFETNRLLKYFNEIFKKNLTIRRNFIKNFDDLFKEIALIISYNLQFRLNVHEFLQRYYRDNHSIKSIIENLQIMITNLLKRDMRYMKKREFSIYVVANLLKNDVANLDVNVNKYNEKIQMRNFWNFESLNFSSMSTSTEKKSSFSSTQLIIDINMNMKNVHTWNYDHFCEIDY